MSPLWTAAMGRPGLIGLGSFGRYGRRPSTLRLGEHEGDTWILTAGEGTQRGDEVEWAAMVSIVGLCSLMTTTDKRRGDERGKGYGAVEGGHSPGRLL
jgi:hypothetical protein